MVQGLYKSEQQGLCSVCTAWSTEDAYAQLPHITPAGLRQEGLKYLTGVWGVHSVQVQEHFVYLGLSNAHLQFVRQADGVTLDVMYNMRKGKKSLQHEGNRND